MKFKSVAFPVPSKGYKVTVLPGEEVVPNAAMSLEEIIARFTRNEKLPIGKETEYVESEDDLEKVEHMDLVDQNEFIERQRVTQKRWAAQEDERKRLEREKLIEEEREKIRQELASKPPEGSKV